MSISWYLFRLQFKYINKINKVHYIQSYFIILHIKEYIARQYFLTIYKLNIVETKNYKLFFKMFFSSLNMYIFK